MIDLGALRSLVEAIKGTSWSWRTAEVNDLCRRMGWTLSADTVDEHAEVAGVVSPILGAPSRRVFAEPRSVRRRLADSTVEVVRPVVSVRITWAGNVWQDEEDAVAAALG